MFTISSPGLTDVVNAFQKAGIKWRHTSAAMQLVAEKVLINWKTLATNTEQSQARWFGKKYADSLSIKSKNLDNMQIKIGPKGKGEGAARVVEFGRKEFDMRKSLYTGKKARMGKNGPYTIVGFQHGMEIVKKHVPEGQFKSMKVMEKETSHTGLSARGEVVSRNYYDMTSDGIGRRIGPLSDIHTKKLHFLSGMVKTRQKVGKAKEKSQYQGLTFRVVSINSPEGSWMFPEINPENTREKVHKLLQKDAQEMIRRATQRDLMEYSQKMAKRGKI